LSGKVRRVARDVWVGKASLMWVLGGDVMKGIFESCIVVRRMVSCLWSCGIPGVLECEGKPPLPLFPKFAREALKDFDCRRLDENCWHA
jgi:hypothetical protein